MLPLDGPSRQPYNGVSPPTHGKRAPHAMPDSRPQKSLFALIYQYRHILGRYNAKLALGVLALIATNALLTAIPWQLKQVVDIIQQIFSHERDPMTFPPLLWASFYQHLWLIAGLATLMLLSRIASRQWLLGAGRRVEFDLRNKLYAHLLRMGPDYFAAHPIGELMSRLTNDVDATKYLVGGGVMMGVNTFLAYALAIPMMLIINWRLALVTFIFYPIVIYLMSRISKKVRQGYYDVQTVLADISTVAQENLNGMMVIQSYVREEHENKRFHAVCDRYFSAYTGLIHERILLFMVLAALSGLSLFLVLLVGGWQVIAHQLNWGGFVAFTMYLEQLAWPTMALGWTISIFQQGSAALQRIDEVFSAEPSIQSPLAASGTAPAPPSAGPGNALGHLEIRHLTFAYHNPYHAKSNVSNGELANVSSENGFPAEGTVVANPVKTAAPVLRDINLDIRPGETIAIVGPVGSGKSTLLRLLPRLLDVPSGTIFMDGQDITSLELPTLRANVVFMPQLSFLFSTTVSQNIAFGKPDILTEGAHPEASIVHAAETASVHLDIQDLPKQYQTLVGERGLMLSGGQRQRVSLARALMMDAPILALDDPFSNVDAETERNIVSALRDRKIFQHKTTLLATHRFSLIALCDRIVLMEQGHILAVGTHVELMASQPLYQKLHHLQELRNALGEWALDPDGKPNGKDADPVLADDETEEDE
jgi:ATP-binding cassette subfamily B multidrug efflux pump